MRELTLAEQVERYGADVVNRIQRAKQEEESRIREEERRRTAHQNKMDSIRRIKDISKKAIFDEIELIKNTLHNSFIRDGVSTEDLKEVAYNMVMEMVDEYFVPKKLTDDEETIRWFREYERKQEGLINEKRKEWKEFLGQ